MLLVDSYPNENGNTKSILKLLKFRNIVRLIILFVISKPPNTLKE